MRKSLIRHGNSLALVIDKPILNLLQINPDTPMEISKDGDRLLVRPCRTASRQRRLEECLQAINGEFTEDLRRLAE
jgi:antitoxin MazE